MKLIKNAVLYLMVIPTILVNIIQSEPVENMISKVQSVYADCREFGDNVKEKISNVKEIFSGEDSTNTSIGSDIVDSTLEVHYIDVGQGDCILIVQDEHSMLIDAGDNSKGTYVQNYLESEGITDLDYVIGTHPHEDHIGGLDVILYKFDVGLVMLPDYILDTRTCEDVYNVVNEKQYDYTIPSNGETYSLGDASFSIICDETYTGNNPNNFSIGVKLEYGESSFLFCGDTESDVEYQLIENNDLDVDVLKLNHHGSNTSSSDEFLNEVTPDSVIVSCGTGNEYGHPHKEVMDKIANLNCDLYRTDMQGTIIATTDGENITWNKSSTDNFQSGGDDISKDYSDYEGQLILNKNSLKIHKPDCESVLDMSENNKEISYKTIVELKNNGYSLCNNCF